MKKYRKTARPLSLLVASILALQPMTAMAVTFADINQAPWPGAEASINRAAELGLVVGETINGKSYFKPKDPVSLTQTCQLAYKVLTETGKASASATVTEKWVTVLNTYKIQSWAHPAVAFCLEEGIISISDLNGFTSGSVNKSATREQAAEILGRALEVGVPSKAATATSTKFKDNASISKDAVPYIALLNDEKIVSGDNVGNFNPKSTLNRTETAVMVTNLYNVLNQTSTVKPPVSLGTQSGKVMDMNSLYVNFENSNAYFRFISSDIPVTLNGESASLAEVVTLFKEGSTLEATVTLDNNNRVTKLTVTAEDTDSDKKATEGVLTGVTYDDEDNDGTITIEKTSTYKIDDADDVEIEIDNEEYDLEELDELFDECKDDDKEIEVKVTLNSKNELTKIKGSVEDADEDEDEDDIDYDKKGDVTDLSEDEIELDDDDTYEIDSWTEIKVDGRSRDLDEMMEKYEDLDDDEYFEAKLVLDDDDDELVAELYLTTKNEDDKKDDEVEGEIENIDDDYIEIDGDEYDLDNDVDVDIKNGDSDIEDLDDLIEAFDSKAFTFEVTVQVEDDEVTEITGEVVEVTGYLSDYDDDWVEVETDWEDVTYDFSDDDDYDDFENDVKDAKKDDDVDMDEIEVTLELEDGEIVNVDLDY